MAFDAYLSPPRPKLIFLDTNVVQNLLTFGEYIYDNYLSPANEQKLLRLDKLTVEDVEALAYVMQLGRRHGWPLALSERTLAELSRTVNEEKRAKLTGWGLRIMEYFQETSALEPSRREHPPGKRRKALHRRPAGLRAASQ